MFKRIFSWMALLWMAIAGFNCKSSIATDAPVLAITWTLVKNETAGTGTSHLAQFVLRNKVGAALTGKDWTLYWSQSPRLVTATEGPAKVSNINGDFYKMEPLHSFSLNPGDSITVSYRSDGHLIKVSDGPLGIYLAWKDATGKEQTAKITDYTVTTFNAPEQYTRNPNDQEPYPDAGTLFRHYEDLYQVPVTGTYPCIPSPAKYQAGTGMVTIGNNISVGAPAVFKNEATLFISELRKQFGIDANLVSETSKDARIQLVNLSNQLGEEGYNLNASEDKGIQINASTPSGIFYGIQTLLSMLAKKEGVLGIPACDIHDAPAFGYRGLHVDVCRNFQSKQTVLRMLDLMGRFKLNRLLFNITEDEGWRLEIPSLPELAEVGSKRGHAHKDSLYLPPAYGSGPDANDPNSYGNGFYTRKDFIEIIQYAHARHIQVIPELNLPGHSRAAIKAMELRYNRLVKAGKKKEAEEYRLIDPNDQSKYVSAQGYVDNTTCVCQPQVFHFFETVLDDILTMYKDAQVPIPMFHTGGDEVPSTAWLESPLCKEFLKQHPEIKNTRNLQSLFFSQMAAALKKRNIRTGAWEEAVMLFQDQSQWRPNPAFVNQGVYPYVWNNLWGNQDLGYKLANAGYPVILCNVTNFYFDLAYNKDPREPGLYWGGFVDAEKPFSFVPFNLFESTWTDEMGRKFQPEIDFKGMDMLRPDARKNIVGLQAQLWSETIKGPDMLEYYYLPKLMAFAQRAWQGQAPWAGQPRAARRSDYNVFLNTVSQKVLPFLDQYNGGYHYRLSPPGIQVAKGMVNINTDQPGLEIRYTTDGSEPTRQSTLFQASFQLPDKTTVVKAATFNTKARKSFTSTFKTSLQ